MNNSLQMQAPSNMQFLPAGVLQNPQLPQQHHLVSSQAMSQSQLHFEALCNTLYGPDPRAQLGQQRAATHDERQRADRELKIFTEDVSNIGALKSYLEKSSSKFAQFVAASALKQLFMEHWSKIPVNEKLSIKDFVTSFLVQKEASLDQ